MIDAHAHLAHSFSNEIIDVIIKKFKSKGGRAIVDTATEAKELEQIDYLLKKYPNIYTVIGLHPELANSKDINGEINKLKVFAKKNDKVIGIGETGLDYLFAKSEKERAIQKILFESHVKLAEELNLPLVIHARGKDFLDYSPYYDVLEIIKSLNFKNNVYFHSYAGDKEFAMEIIDLGYFIGVNGISTYSNAKNLKEIIKITPLENILLETDTPYLIPSNMDRTELEDKKINEPIGIFYTAKRIAKIKEIPEDEVLKVTTENTRKFFERIL